MRKPRFAIVVSRFNEEVTSALHKNCRRKLRSAGIPERNIHSVEVPGGFEIPWAAHELARSRKYDTVITLGCILKGSTPQNDMISQAVYTHLQRISIETRIPVVTGVITPKTYAQAVARTKGDMDRGKEAAEAALEMAAIKLTGVNN
jgi:6,7-dimethyl-8-ribityllumazine synthase